MICKKSYVNRILGEELLYADGYSMNCENLANATEYFFEKTEENIKKIIRIIDYENQELEMHFYTNLCPLRSKNAKEIACDQEYVWNGKNGMQYNSIEEYDEILQKFKSIIIRYGIILLNELSKITIQRAKVIEIEKSLYQQCEFYISQAQKKYSFEKKDIKKQIEILKHEFGAGVYKEYSIDEDAFDSTTDMRGEFLLKLSQEELNEYRLYLAVYGNILMENFSGKLAWNDSNHGICVRIEIGNEYIEIGNLGLDIFMFIFFEEDIDKRIRRYNEIYSIRKRLEKKKGIRKISEKIFNLKEPL